MLFDTALSAKIEISLIVLYNKSVRKIEQKFLIKTSEKIYGIANSLYL